MQFQMGLREMYLVLVENVQELFLDDYLPERSEIGQRVVASQSIIRHGSAGTHQRGQSIRLQAVVDFHVGRVLDVFIHRICFWIVEHHLPPAPVAMYKNLILSIQSL